ncbi:MAG: hypothetical protein ACODAJ_14545 [Planctomycetota bacterium]
MAGSAPQGDFKLVLTGVNPANQAAIVAELRDVFQLDQKLVTEIVASAAQGTPVILLDGMSRAQASNVRTHLARVLKLGAQMSLTAETVGQAKRIPWPAPPPVTRRPTNIFMCPSCGERFIVQRWQPAPAARPGPQPQAEAPAAPAGQQPAPAEQPEPQPPPAPAEAEEEEPIPEAEPLEAEPLEAEALEAEAIEAVEAEELPVAEMEAPEAEEVPEAEAMPIEEEPAEPSPQPAAPPQQQQPAPAAQPKQPARPKPQPKPAAEPEPAGPRYDVSVAKVPESKQGALADLLVDRADMSPEDAEKAVGRTVVLVCKGGTSAEADDWRKALLGIGLKPRIRKK